MFILLLRKHEIAWLMVGKNKTNKTSPGVSLSCSRTEQSPV